ncbi:hypothetical protein FKM82_015295 [Ascaphus truei]
MLGMCVLMCVSHDFIIFPFDVILHISGLVTFCHFHFILAKLQLNLENVHFSWTEFARLFTQFGFAKSLTSTDFYVDRHQVFSASKGPFSDI